MNTKSSEHLLSYCLKTWIIARGFVFFQFRPQLDKRIGRIHFILLQVFSETYCLLGEPNENNGQRYLWSELSEILHEFQNCQKAVHFHPPKTRDAFMAK